MQAFCVKCRAKREIKDAKSVIMKNGKPVTQSVCPTWLYKDASQRFKK